MVCGYLCEIDTGLNRSLRFYIKHNQQDFGNGRGLATGGRPCGMKEVVILNGKHRGAWVKCLVIHKVNSSVHQPAAQWRRKSL